VKLQANALYRLKRNPKIVVRLIEIGLNFSSIRVKYPAGNMGWLSSKAIEEF